VSAAAEARAQAAMLVRLRRVRMEAAQRRLAEARDAARAAERLRADADAATAEADAAHRAAQDRLGGDLSEAERLLAVLDQARFRRSVAVQAAEEAEAEERRRLGEEAEHRRAAILARARQAGVEERAAALVRRARRRAEERAQADFEDGRRK